jgi:hypothetical protein
MITKRTVLILGAGASHHLGYPLAGELIAEICQRVKEDATLNSRMPVNPSCPRHLEPLYPGVTVGDAMQFARHLGRGVYSSIDEFLEKNPDYIDLGKLLIVRCLKQYEDVEELFPAKKSGWYHYLASSLLTDDPNEIPNVPLTIISFNYDRSLEAYLHEVVANRYRMSRAEAWKIVKRLKIIHPHGVLGAYPEIPYKKTEIEGSALLAKLASGIRVIHELGDAKPTAFCSPQFRAANQALRNAERIFFLGFGFHEANLRRFGFFSADSLLSVFVRSTCCGLETREKASLVRRLGAFGFGEDVLRLKSDCNNFFRKVADLN